LFSVRVTILSGLKPSKIEKKRAVVRRLQGSREIKADLGICKFFLDECCGHIFVPLGFKFTHALFLLVLFEDDCEKIRLNVYSLLGEDDLAWVQILEVESQIRQLKLQIFVEQIGP
jgi:hypothetical protein